MPPKSGSRVDHGIASTYKGKSGPPGQGSRFAKKPTTITKRRVGITKPNYGGENAGPEPMAPGAPVAPSQDEE